MITADFTAARWRKSSYSSDSGSCVEVAFAPATWRKSSHSGNTTACVEVAFASVAWHKSSYSGNSAACVEVAITAPAIGVRDSKHPTGGILTFPAPAWITFLKSVSRS